MPIFDARHRQFNLQSDLENLGAVLPTFTGKIPFGSCILIAHSMTSYIKDGDANLSTNIQWVVVLGTEDG